MQEFFKCFFPRSGFVSRCDNLTRESRVWLFRIDCFLNEWNHFTITCKGPKITLIFNGEKVLDANLDDWKEARKNPDGTPNKFSPALKDFARKGPIGFQGLHGKAMAPVFYRNLKIKVLE